MAWRYVHGSTYSPVSASRYCGWCMCHKSTTGRRAGASMQRVGPGDLRAVQAAQHVRRDQYHAVLRDMVAPLILHQVRADDRAVGDLAAFIDDGALDRAVPPHVHMRQDDGAFDEGPLIDAHVREDQWIADLCA